MKQSDARKAILQRFMNQWPGLSSNVPYVFEDVAFDEVATYARVELDFVDEVQQTMGQPPNRKFLGTGTITITLYSPGNAGTKTNDALAELVRQLYQTQRFGAVGTEEGVITWATTATRSNAKSDGQYDVMVTSTPFEYVDVR